MHGLIFETSIWLLAGSTRYLALISSELLRKKQAQHLLADRSVWSVTRDTSQHTTFRHPFINSGCYTRIHRTENEAHQDTITCFTRVYTALILKQSKQTHTLAVLQHALARRCNTWAGGVAEKKRTCTRLAQYSNACYTALYYCTSKFFKSSPPFLTLNP